MEKEQLKEEIEKLLDLISPEVVAGLSNKELESLQALLKKIEELSSSSEEGTGETGAINE